MCLSNFGCYVMPVGQKWYLWKVLSILELFFEILCQPANKKQQQIFNAPLERMSSHCAAYLMTLSAALSYEHLHTANRLLIQGDGKYRKLIPFKSFWSLLIYAKLCISWMCPKLKASFRILVFWVLMKDLYTLVCVFIQVQWY